MGNKHNMRLKDLADAHGTLLYVYSLSDIDKQINALAYLKLPFGYTPRYAMKANSNPDIVRHIISRDVGIDASSSYEAQQAIEFGVEPSVISLTSQQSAHNLKELVAAGIKYNATSMHQLKLYGHEFPGTSVGVRINPGIGSGFSGKANVGGLASSFGIWHEQIDDIKVIADKYKLTIDRLHTHIGSGTDMDVWRKSIGLSLAAAAQFHELNTINLGGGFKVARMPGDTSTDIQEVGRIIHDSVTRFAQDNGSELQVELEPGGFLVASGGVLLALVDDIVSTGNTGYTFMKLNTGMNDFMRPTLYAAQHPIEVLNDSEELHDYVVVGHNCESGDLLTPASYDAEQIDTRRLRKAQIGDIVAIGGVGAYGASMAVHGYNSFPSAKEIII